MERHDVHGDGDCNTILHSHPPPLADSVQIMCGISSASWQLRRSAVVSSSIGGSLKTDGTDTVRKVRRRQAADDDSCFSLEQSYQPQTIYTVTEVYAS